MNTARQRFIFIAMVLIILVPAIMQSILYKNGNLDDAFISFRYAKNLIHNYGLVWNPGEKPVEGYTNFLWVLFSAFSIQIGVHPLLFSKILGVISTIGKIILSFFILYLPYYLWRFTYYGHFFPNSFYVKHTGGGLGTKNCCNTY